MHRCATFDFPCLQIEHVASETSQLQSEQSKQREKDLADQVELASNARSSAVADCADLSERLEIAEGQLESSEEAMECRSLELQNKDNQLRAMGEQVQIAQTEEESMRIKLDALDTILRAAQVPCSKNIYAL